MATETFIWPITARSSGATTYRTRSAQFGDGYRQESKDGLNNVVDEWEITVQGREAQIGPIKVFLDARGGAEAFYWMPPLGVQALYTANNVRTAGGDGDYYTLTATFSRAYRP